MILHSIWVNYVYQSVKPVSFSLWNRKLTEFLSRKTDWLTKCRNFFLFFFEFSVETYKGISLVKIWKYFSSMEKKGLWNWHSLMKTTNWERHMKTHNSYILVTVSLAKQKQHLSFISIFCSKHSVFTKSCFARNSLWQKTALCIWTDALAHCAKDGHLGSCIRLAENMEILQMKSDR